MCLLCVVLPQEGNRLSSRGAAYTAQPPREGRLLARAATTVRARRPLWGIIWTLTVLPKGGGRALSVRRTRQPRRALGYAIRPVAPLAITVRWPGWAFGGLGQSTRGDGGHCHEEQGENSTTLHALPPWWSHAVRKGHKAREMHRHCRIVLHLATNPWLESIGARGCSSVSRM